MQGPTPVHGCSTKSNNHRLPASHNTAGQENSHSGTKLLTMATTVNTIIKQPNTEQAHLGQL
jgi:hypothetical protein